MVRIGITVHYQFSFFSAGSPQTALALAEVYTLAGHSVKFIRTESPGNTWWEDVKGLAEGWSSVTIDQAKAEPFDVVFEIGNHLLKPDDRKAVAKRAIWFCRKHPLFHDIEASLFPFEQAERDLEGVQEIWLFEELCSRDDKQYLELLTRKPVRLVPLLWSPTGVEFHRQEMKAPVWSQIFDLPEVRAMPWALRIAETNMSSQSSCTVPLLIAREIRKKSKAEINKVIKIHNAENVRNSEFFRANVLDHAFSDIQDVSGHFMGRQRIIDFVYDPKCVMLAHSRFTSWRPSYMDALWVGIPLLHNSKLLRDIDEETQAGYYADNNIQEGRLAFDKLIELASRPGGTERLIQRRMKIAERLTPLSKTQQDAWSSALQAGMDQVKGVAPVPVPVSVSVASRKPLVVGFTDMWDSFNPEYNMFTLMLEEAGKHLKGGVKDVIGKAGAEGVDLLIFGPFGDAWKSVPPHIPKVHFTGENTDPLQRDDIKLNLGFKHMNFVGQSYLRLPLWMLEINWFHADVERIGNPKPLPIDSVTKVHPEWIGRKNKFCAFVVTNPCQPMRNNAFQWLSQYKRVDSAGRLFNNVGDAIFAGLGGGGGELKKFEFLKDYKFCITYENASEAGYTTEKMLHAKAAGCIPIYWGDPKVERDFDTSGFIDAREALTSDSLIKLVKEVDENPTVWLQKYSMPALDEVRRDGVRRTLSECARRMWNLVEREEETENIPLFLGASSDTEAPGAIIKVEPPSVVTAPVVAAPPSPPISSKAPPADLRNTVFVTAVNNKFLAPLQLWLQSIGAQKSEVTELSAIVYLMSDVSKENEQNFIESFPFAQYRRFPSDAPEDFKDLWSVEHYAWKVWLLKELVKEDGLKSKLIYYIDTGCMMVRWPRAWLNEVVEHGISVLEDSEQKNKTWCHAEFRKALGVKGEELEDQQIWAGMMAFVGGHHKAKALLEEAWIWAQKRSVIVGQKWIFPPPSDGIIGHRHDQSIFSILTKRMGIHRYPMTDLYCHTSLRHTFMKGYCFYVHRGQFKMHEPILPGIDDAWVINLDRRKDRMDKFKLTHPDLAARAMRLSAFEGVKLKLTPRLARLFKPHDFKWKKAVMGCALSHLAVWMQLITDKPDIHSYLVLEDDVRLKPEWRKAWTEAMEKKAIPEDYDVVYLGGILPPNREAFEHMAVERVNDHVSRVAPNSVFGQDPPNRYFHFCAYAYVLSRKGAQKVMEALKMREGYWTSADHMICNLTSFLNMYFLHPLVAGCFQDDDPAYQASAFNDFSRKDSFDSDLWNNNEHFSQDEVARVLKESDPLDVLGALEDARNAMNEVQETVIGQESPAQAKQELVSSTTAAQHTLPRTGPRRLVSVAGPPMKSNEWHEYAWLKQLLSENAGISMEVERIPENAPAPKDSPIVVVQRPHVEAVRSVLKRWVASGVQFYVLHISDEFCDDPIDFYSWDACLGVMRNYVREDIKESAKVKVFPLGFHWAIPNGEPLIHTPRPPFRELQWSFVGTDWRGRSKKLEILKQVPGEHKCVFQDSWNAPTMLGREEMLSIYLNSRCVICPAGNNVETFRVYEALEAGAVPILVNEEGAEPYLEYLNKHLPLLVGQNWTHAAQLVHVFKDKPDIYEDYRSHLLTAWETFKADIKNDVKTVFGITSTTNGAS